MTELLHGDVTDPILRCFYKAGNKMGHGFLESVYHNVMFIELGKTGLQVRSKVRTPVRYDGKIVGDFEADLVVEDRVIIEIKAARAIDPSAVAQVINYLRASELEVGLILNFGPKLEFKRVVFENARKLEPRKSAVSAQSAASP